ncbi:hypothetical protein C0991_010076, partial [Blastosporella zonata]
MNDPGLEKPVQEGFEHVTRSLKDQIPHDHDENQLPPGPRAEFRRELEEDEDEEL